MREEVPFFRAWTQQILPRLARHPGTPKSVRVIAARERFWTTLVRRQWEWFAYLIKQLRPTWFAASGTRLNRPSRSGNS